MTSSRSSPLLSRLRAWLSPAEAPRSADLIFVLAGRVHRKEYALALFRQGLAPKILLSVGRFEIRRFSKLPIPVPLDLLEMAQEMPPPQRHYFVFFQEQQVRVEHVPPGRFGTITEVEALAQWLDANPVIHSILVISSATHLRRIRLCCRALLCSNVDLAYLAAPPALPGQPPAATSELQQDRAQPEQRSVFVSAKKDLLELFKLTIYWVLLKIRRKR